MVQPKRERSRSPCVVGCRRAITVPVSHLSVVDHLPPRSSRTMMPRQDSGIRIDTTSALSAITQQLRRESSAGVCSTKRNGSWRQHMFSLFARLISHQPAVLFSQNKPATSNQPAVLFSQNKPAPAISHQPTEQAGCRRSEPRPRPCSGVGPDPIYIDAQPTRARLNGVQQRTSMAMSS
jgi:hypothetical protein